MFKLILKLVAMPFALVLTLVAAVFNFLLSVSAIFFGIASTLVFLGAVILFITGEPIGGAAFLAVAFLVSPFGIPALAGWLVGLLDSAGGALRGFIVG
ncbi:MAG: CD1845 family protein [Defluviitaleaceae bacterium]|nr:CD1845 family protein [Defluviitaleaceae bacterium]